MPYQTFLATALEDAAHRQAVARILTDPEHPHFAKLTQWADAVVNGLPIRRVEVKDTTPQRAFTGEEAALQLIGHLPNFVALASPEQRRAILTAVRLAAIPEADYEVLAEPPGAARRR